MSGGHGLARGDHYRGSRKRASQLRVVITTGNWLGVSLKVTACLRRNGAAAGAGGDSALARIALGGPAFVAGLLPLLHGCLGGGAFALVELAVTVGIEPLENLRIRGEP